MAIANVCIEGTVRDWNDVIKHPARFDSYEYGGVGVDVIHRRQTAPAANVRIEMVDDTMIIKNHSNTEQIIVRLVTTAAGEFIDVVIEPRLFIMFPDLDPATDIFYFRNNGGVDAESEQLHIGMSYTYAEGQPD